MRKSSSSKPIPPGLKFFISRVFPLIFVVLGCSATFFGIRELIAAKASADWPGTEGKVIESSVGNLRRSSAVGSKDRNFYAKILYEFIVDGTTFNGKRVAYGDSVSINHSNASKIVKRYPKGKVITVHYMPGNPEECLLKPGLNGRTFILPGFGFLFFCVGSLMAVLLPRGIRKQEIIDQGSEGDAVTRAP